MSKTADTYRALSQLGQAGTPAGTHGLDRILALAEQVQAAVDAGNVGAAVALLDDFAAMRLLSEALPSWDWPPVVENDK